MGIAGLAGGIAFRSFFDWGAAFIFALIALAGLFLLVRVFARAKKIFGFAAIVLFAAALGIARYESAESSFGSPLLESAIGQNALMQGIVAEDPDRRDTHTKIAVTPQKIGGQDIQQATRVLVLVPSFESYHYGDELAINGTLKKPENFEAEDAHRGRPFDYVGYLKKDGIGYQMYYPKIEKIAEGKGNPVVAPLISFKRALLTAIERAVPEPSAGLLGGILFGEKHLLSDELLESLRITGIVHVVVLSGYNISIIARYLGGAAALVSSNASFAVSTVGILAFGTMVGWGSTAARAVLMALIILFARVTGRVYAGVSALFVAAAIMLAWNPFILAYDPSFQLSFLATFGILTFTPFLENGRILSRLPRFLREITAATLSTQAWVLPLLIYQMGQVSLVALMVNMLTLPIMPAVMLFGFLSGFLGLVAPLIGAAFGFVAHALLSYAVVVVSIFEAVPFAVASVGLIPLPVLVSLYAWAFWKTLRKSVYSSHDSGRSA